MLHGFQKWGGKGFGRLKMKHEKGFGCFMVPMSGVRRVWEGQTRSMKTWLGVSWFRRVGWEGFGKAQTGSHECCGNGLGRPKMKHEKGVACFMVPWEGSN